VGGGVGVGVSEGRGVGSAASVDEGTIAGVDRETGLFVPQAFRIKTVINGNQ